LTKLIKNKKFVSFIIALQEAFISIIPYFVLIGFLVLINTAIIQFKINIGVSFDVIKNFTKVLQSFSSIIPVIAISFFLAKRIKVSEIIAVLLAVTAFISAVYYEYDLSDLKNFPFGFIPASITIPIISTFFLQKLYPFFALNIDIKDGKAHAYRLFSYLMVFFVAYFVTMLFYITTDYYMDFMIEKYNPFHTELPDNLLLIIRNIFVQIFWFFGMHGEHMVNALFGKNILFDYIFPNLTYGEFQRIFVSIGGAGAGLALMISLLIAAKDKAVKKIVAITSPLEFFNIDNILIFLAIVFNRFMFLPFLLIPLINIFIAYFGIHLLHTTFNKYYIVWCTPVFFDAFIKTHSLSAILLQLIILSTDTAIYTYFLNRYFKTLSIETHSNKLENNLEIELNAKTDIKAFQSNIELIDANVQVDDIISKLNKNNLMIYYQPKVDIKHNKADKFEALLRYNDNGRIRGPFFLGIIEKAGLAPIIDIWVCKQVKKDMQIFKQNNLNPKISVNLHPDTLTSTDAITKILEILKDENIAFEIIERSFVNKTATSNIKRIKQHGYEISIDDFGIGYSSLETLIKQEIDELKLDKSLIDEIETDKGYLICKHTIKLCKDLNISVVAEGVETKSQLEILKNFDVDLIQGYIFSPAIPIDKAIKFSHNFNLNDF